MNHRAIRSRGSLLAAVSALLPALAACGKSQGGFLPPRTVVRQLDPSAGSPPGPQMATATGTTAEARGLRLAPPDHWLPAPLGRFRIASYRTDAGVDISITAFPGDAGGIRNNADRWLQQLGLPPLQPADLASMARDRLLATEGIRVQATSADGGRGVLGWIVPPAERTALPDHTVFLKATGGPEELAAEQAALLRFAQGWNANSEAAPAAGGPAPAPAGEIASAPTRDEAPNMRRLAWQVPQGWSAAATGGMRLGAWHPGGDPEVLVVASVLPGQAGGAAETHAMWRDSVVGAAAPAGREPNVQLLGREVAVCIVIGPDQALLGVAGHGVLDGDSLFLKATGPVAQVRALQRVFLDFCTSVELR